MEKKTSKEISDGIRKGSKYMYYDGISYSAATAEARVNREKLEYNVVTAVISQGDYYLIEAVHKLGFATAETILHRIRAGARHNEEYSLCLVKEGKVTNHRTVRGRLEFLTRQGLLHCHEYVDTYGNINYIFICSSEGFRAFTTALDRREQYNKDMVYKPCYEVFKYLAANTVAYVLGMSLDIKRVQSYGKAFYNKEGKKHSELIYGQLLFGEEQKNHLILEPVFFSVDEKIVSKEENIARVQKRLENLRDIVKDYVSSGEETYVIFIVENGAGLTQLKELLLTMELDFFLERCYFTSENVVSVAFIDKGSASDCLLEMSVSSGQVRFKQKDLPLG